LPVFGGLGVDVVVPRLRVVPIDEIGTGPNIELDGGVVGLDEVRRFSVVVANKESSEYGAIE
jgi:hypothetical protein